MDAISPERFTADAGADAVTPYYTYLLATVAGFHPTYSQGRPWPYRPRYDSPLLRILHASRPQLGRKVGGHLRRRQRQVSLLSASLNAREQEL